MNDDNREVKVENWGPYLMQRLKLFFNRTDHCDLTLQFQDDAQLKVHRLVLNACTEYFELLERTCEMYDDCLVMPDDLQADVVVPIINFMYTGHLKFKIELLDRLYQTSLVMNMPVLAKLLAAHRHRPAPVHSYSKKLDFNKISKMAVPSSSGTNKRSFSKAFVDLSDAPSSKKAHHSSYSSKTEKELINGMGSSEHSSFNYSHALERNKNMSEPRPTRYELPEELDEDNIFGNSFTSVSYTSKPLMVHPETVKQYGSRKGGLFEDSSISKRFFRTPSTVDIVDCKKISNSNIFENDSSECIGDEKEIFQQCSYNKNEVKDASQLFDQILDNDGPKLTIEAKDNKQASNIDHAKIISEVLKKYPHLVKSNKNIKLKILNTSKPKKKGSYEEKDVQNQLMSDFTFESDVINSKEAARLIALGAENVKGPWICLICGTPGRALHFTTYYKFRRHLVTVHNEKPVANICEYCGLKSQKRNYLLHHLYTKHGIDPPPNYHFPKCNICNYIALTEAFLVKHKVSHLEYRSFRCNVCAATFQSSNMLLSHIQKTGHKYSADRKANLQCIYCLKVFLRESNLYAHLKTTHKDSAKTDGIIDDSDDERIDEEENIRSNTELKSSMNVIKVEVPTYDSFNECNMSYQSSRSNTQVTPKKPRILMPHNKLKILNSGLNTQISTVSSMSKATELKQQHKKIHQEQPASNQNQFLEVMDTNTQMDNQSEIVLIDNNEYIIQNYQLVPKKERSNEEYVLHNTINNTLGDTLSTSASSSSMDYHSMDNVQPESSKMIGKKTTLPQPIQIVVSNEEEYKALMSSNHSIIFESTDNNKALAVLTTPGGTSIQRNSIDLHGGQTNDVMIIPDNYPINVSETVSADNSNIVVVYSHPMGDQNKQFQFITSQGIEAQFVQTPTMITQNYETVVTSTPVMNTHVLNAPVESWHSNLSRNSNKLPISCNTEMQTRVAPIQVATIENMSSNHLKEDLPKVQVTGTQPLPTNIIQNTPVNNDNPNFYNHPNVQNPVDGQSEMKSMCDQISSNSMSNVEQQSIINSVEELEHSGTISEVDSTPSNDVDANTINTINQCNINNINNTDMSLHQIAESNNIILVENNPCSIIVEGQHSSNNFIVQNEQIISSACETPVSNCSQEVSVHTTNVEQVNTNIVTETEMEGTVSKESQNNVCDTHTRIVIYEDEENITKDTTTQTVPSHENINIAVQNESVKIGHDQISQTEVDRCDHAGKNNNVQTEGQVIIHTVEIIQTQLSDNVEPQINDNVEPQINNNVELPINDNVEPPINDNVEPPINDNVEPPINDNVEPQIKDNVEAQINERLDADENAQTILDEHVQPEINKNVGDEKKDLSKKEVGDHVVNLASEWSDDDNETTLPPVIDQRQNVVYELDTSTAEQSAELEETIENIAEEMKKQGAIEIRRLDNTKVSEQSNLTNQVKTGSDEVKEVTKASQEKISSLLNDWDDNESQGDNENEESIVDLNKEQNEEKNTSINDNIIAVESVPSEKDNKIKSLVSDWDEDEEEPKE